MRKNAARFFLSSSSLWLMAAPAFSCASDFSAVTVHADYSPYMFAGAAILSFGVLIYFTLSKRSRLLVKKGLAGAFVLLMVGASVVGLMSAVPNFFGGISDAVTMATASRPAAAPTHVTPPTAFRPVMAQPVLH